MEEKETGTWGGRSVIDMAAQSMTSVGLDVKGCLRDTLRRWLGQFHSPQGWGPFALLPEPYRGSCQGRVILGLSTTNPLRSIIMAWVEGGKRRLGGQGWASIAAITLLSLFSLWV